MPSTDTKLQDQDKGTGNTGTDVGTAVVSKPNPSPAPPKSTSKPEAGIKTPNSPVTPTVTPPTDAPVVSIPVEPELREALTALDKKGPVETTGPATHEPPTLLLEEPGLTNDSGRTPIQRALNSRPKPLPWKQIGIGIGCLLAIVVFGTMIYLLWPSTPPAAIIKGQAQNAEQVGAILESVVSTQTTQGVTQTTQGATITQLADSVKKAGETAASALTKATTAETTANDAKTKAGVAETTAGNALKNSATALQTANEAKDGLKKLTALAQKAGETANGARATADSAKKLLEATQLEAKHQTELQALAATNAQTTADEAKKKADASLELQEQAVTRTNLFGATKKSARRSIAGQLREAMGEQPQ